MCGALTLSVRKVGRVVVDGDKQLYVNLRKKGGDDESLFLIERHMAAQP